MKHPHYKKPVAGLQFVDVYRVLALFGVTDPCIQHAVKKMLVAGGRGAKDISQDVQEAIDTLQRWQEMRKEDGVAGKLADVWGGLMGGKPNAPHIEPASLIDDESPRMQAIAQNGNDGAAYSEIDRLRAAEAFNVDLPVSVEEAIALGAVPQREPCKPRHRCQTCAGGHATHLCAAGT
jgi:hypothetical protein